MRIDCWWCTFSDDGRTRRTCRNPRGWGLFGTAWLAYRTSQRSLLVYATISVWCRCVVTEFSLRLWHPLARCTVALCLQSVIGDCSVVASIDLALYFEQCTGRRVLTSMIYPQDVSGTYVAPHVCA